MLRPLLRGQVRVAVAMSGGVDSSVSAHLLKRASSTEGLDLVGVHMVIGTSRMRQMGRLLARRRSESFRM